MGILRGLIQIALTVVLQFSIIKRQIGKMDLQKRKAEIAWGLQMRFKTLQNLFAGVMKR
jgi:hypothetical protein